MKKFFDGVLYDIPEEELKKLNDYIENTWKPSMDQGLMTDSGAKRIPTNIRALSFTIFLKEWYRDNFSKYIVERAA